MAIPLKKTSSAESLAMISHVVLTSFIFATLYIGREILVPLALAVLLTFMLGPLADKLQRRLGRVGAVMVIVALMFAVTGAAGWVIGRQVVDLANQLPNYKENISSKLHSLQLPSTGPFHRLSVTLEELKRELPGGTRTGPSLSKNASADTTREPLPVQIANGPDKRLEFIQVVLGPLGNAAIVLLLLIFMLIERDDLRNRFIILIGQGRISATTKAMADAGSRVSRYLLMQLVVNVTYGIPIAVGLSLIGVPNAVLWGALATVLRFIPYVGPWIAASFPVLLSLAISPSWSMPLMTISLYVVIELISNNVMEPWLYGSSTGVTPIALIIAALVWTWLWGPVGLVLATPLTVCLVVLGRHIPRLAFFSVALSDEEPLTPAEDLYHRLYRIGDHDEAEVVDTFLRTNQLETLFDTVLIPVVTAAESDFQLGLLDSDQLDSLHHHLDELLENLEIRHQSHNQPLDPNLSQLAILPVKSYRDELGGKMLSQLLLQRGHQVEVAPSKMVSGELVNWVRENHVQVVCLSAVLPTSITHTRYLCARLRKCFPSLKIIVGLWEITEKSPETLASLNEAGADEIVTTVADAVERMTRHEATVSATGASLVEPDGMELAVNH